MVDPTQITSSVSAGVTLVARLRRHKPMVFVYLSYPHATTGGERFDQIRIRVLANNSVCVQEAGVAPGSWWRRNWWRVTRRKPYTRLGTRPRPGRRRTGGTDWGTHRALPASVTPDDPLTVIADLRCPLPAGVRRGRRTCIWLRVNNHRFLYGCIRIPATGNIWDSNTTRAA